ncbi:multidrug efflux SMR transporter [Streptomyces sp. HNM0574]|uniref:DMT family transporter n=1 Tax=Streptomyces sp. HNM0574 TaxID=2714954 RepID=UPI00146ACB3F|nr:multidrug efflux SMR transporter [Streptomyces sp. HNM0574]NLU65884.1 multidrug efflux SMR transporter [Streptomyces sp. HNM0574]
MAWWFLCAAVASEVVGATATRASDGFTEPVPTAVAITGVVGAYYFLSLALKRGMGLGKAYGVWAALGVATVALIGAALLGEPLSPLQIAGLLLVVAGVLALEWGGEREGGSGA